MAEPVLDSPRVVAGFGQGVAAGCKRGAAYERGWEGRTRRAPMRLMSRVTASDAPAGVVKLTVPPRAAAACFARRRFSPLALALLP